jgi:hypothetical protein
LLGPAWLNRQALPQLNFVSSEKIPDAHLFFSLWLELIK